jgi:hypothetical protein
MVIEFLAEVVVATGVINPASSDWAFRSVLRCHIGLEANDGINSLVPARAVEVESAVHVAMICHP